MNNEFQLEASIRTNAGKADSRRLRRLKDQIPGVIYGAKKDPLLIVIEHRKIIKAIENEAFFSHIITIKIGAKTEQVLIKELQRHPFKPQIVHVDFQRITGKEKLHRRVPIHFINEDKAPGVKQGGIVSHHCKDIEIICTPANLPEYIAVDLTSLELNQSMHFSDLQMPEGVQISASTSDSAHNQPVVSIAIPTVATEEKSATNEDEATKTQQSEDTKK